MYLAPISIKRQLIHWKLLALVKYYIYLQHLLNGSKCFHRLSKILFFSCIIVIFLNKTILEIKVFSSLFRFFNSTVIESKVILLRTAWHKTSSNGFTGCYNSVERMQYFSYLNNLTLRETQALMSYSAYIMINLFYLLEKSLVPFFFCSWYLFFDIQFVFKNFFGISFHYILTSIQGFFRTFFFFLLV